MNDLHVIVPSGIDDPTRPSGGNVYDRRVCAGLAAIGWSVREHAVVGDWPVPDAAARAAVAAVLAALADDALVLIDGIVASVVPEVAAQQRLRVFVIVHMLHRGAAGDGLIEAAVLRAATGVIATSEWTRAQLVAQYGLDGHRIHVVEPGVDPAPLAVGSPDGGALLCVAAVTPVKGHDLLVPALAQIADLHWHCSCVGALDLDRGFAARVQRCAARSGIADRVRWVGAHTGAALDEAYATADLLVLCSRTETYGMVVTEALARGVPVIAASVGGVPEALGGTDELPGILVPPEDPAALAGALRRWLGDPDLRQRLRRAAGERRASLTDWAGAADRLSGVLTAARV